VQSARCADDQAMTANTEKGLQKILDETNKVVKKSGVKINIKKTKVMNIGRKPSTIKLTVDGEYCIRWKNLNIWEAFFHHLDTQKRISVLG